jgi:hypothetical protein
MGPEVKSTVWQTVLKWSRFGVIAGAFEGCGGKRFDCSSNVWQTVLKWSRFGVIAGAFEGCGGKRFDCSSNVSTVRQMFRPGVKHRNGEPLKSNCLSIS